MTFQLSPSLSQEQLQNLELQWERGGITTGIERYKAGLKPRIDPWTGQSLRAKSEATLAPGKALVSRAVEPVAEAIVEWYEHLISGKANRSAEVAAAIAPLFEPTDVDMEPQAKHVHRLAKAKIVAMLSLNTAFGHIGQSKSKAMSAIARVLRDEAELTVISRTKDQKYSDLVGEDKTYEGLIHVTVQKLNSTSTDAQRKGKAIQAFKDKVLGVGYKAWSDNLNAKIGGEFLSFVVEITGWFFIEESLENTISTKAGKSLAKTVHTLELVPHMSELLAQSHEFAAGLTPQIKPMLSQPRDWTSIYEGGFELETLSRNVPFIKLHNKAVLRDIDSQIDDDGEHALSSAFEAANRLQKTGFQVNSSVLSTVEALWEQGGDIGCVPAREPRDPRKEVALPCAEEDKDTFKAENPAIWKEFIKARHEVYQYNAMPRRLGDKLGFVRTLNLAKELEGFQTPFYFVFTNDFRGRNYANSPELSPQGNDLHKALLTFAEAKPVSEEASVWIAVHGANAWDNKGKDDPWLLARYPTQPERSLGKTTYTDRYEWVLDHKVQIQQSAEYPTECPWWQEADQPFQFLAFCFEWNEWLKSQAKGETFYSCLPIAADGACNAIQWWTGLLRDETTAHKVNLVNVEMPGDIYGDVAGWVKGYVAKLTTEGTPSEKSLAMFWTGKISRGVVKTPTMTKAYGSTHSGSRKQIKKKLTDEKSGDMDFKGSDPKFQKLALNELNKWTQMGIREEVKAAAVGMDWLQMVAGHVTKAGVPLNWTTPDGFIVWQGYVEFKPEKIDTYLSGSAMIPRKSYVAETIDQDTGEILREINTSNAVSAKKGCRVITTLQRETGVLNLSKNRSSIAPNFVHALDGSMLRVVVRNCFDRGITAMSCVHDSYATHAADYETMQEITRESFVLLQREPLLEHWFKQVTMQLTEDELKELTKALTKKFGSLMPPMGSLDIEQVLDSEYFFG